MFFPLRAVKWCVTPTDFHMLNHLCIPEIDPSWAQCVTFQCAIFSGASAPSASPPLPREPHPPRSSLRSRLRLCGASPTSSPMEILPDFQTQLKIHPVSDAPPSLSVIVTPSLGFKGTISAPLGEHFLCPLLQAAYLPAPISYLGSLTSCGLGLPL